MMMTHRLQVFVLFFFLVGNAYGETQKKFFTLINAERARALLGDYPVTGSDEEIRDFEILLKYQDSRTEEECRIASTQQKTTLRNLFVNENGPLTNREARRVSFITLKAYIESGINTQVAKKTFKRPRPYLTNSLIKPCIKLEGSYAYPSGHTTLARVFAHVLSRRYPGRAEAFLKRADEVAENRILGGVHHPSDIEAGKKLGDLIAKKMLQSQSFLKELEKN